MVVNSSSSFLRHGNGLADAVVLKGDAIAVAWTVDGSLYLTICEARGVGNYMETCDTQPAAHSIAQWQRRPP